ncbi:MAG TPA: pyridoxamine 5'-phosphate oxidase family protein [Anaerolineae bacterium]|nr:pyridoxamine 5'-phosphate oxidase family protein [Anaerolineae bacterium]HQI86976.1 pyridoxamine 5'-phosphate oxidase family protein [Anaerolineae bacterium]
MNQTDHIEEELRALFAAQRFAVLATTHGDQPHASLIAFIATDDLRHVIFATERDTRKYSLLHTNARIALLVASHANRAEDPQEAIAVTVSGRAEEVTGDERKRLAALYRARHPYLADFVETPTTALFRVMVTTYRMVSQFQEIREWRPTLPESA